MNKMFQHENDFNFPRKTTLNYKKCKQNFIKKKHKKLRKYGELNQRYKITEL